MQNKFPVHRLIFPEIWFWFESNEAANQQKLYAKQTAPQTLQLFSETNSLVNSASKRMKRDFATEKLLGSPRLPGTEADLPLVSLGDRFPVASTPSFLLGLFFFLIIWENTQHHIQILSMVRMDQIRYKINRTLGSQANLDFIFN